MDRDQLHRTLMHMERLRMDSYEAETEEECKRMIREYSRLWRQIKPYVDFKPPAPAPSEPHAPSDPPV